jgi:hypothetical protein
MQRQHYRCLDIAAVDVDGLVFRRDEPSGRPKRVQLVATASMSKRTRASVATMVISGELPPWALSITNLRMPCCDRLSAMPSQRSIASPYQRLRACHIHMLDRVADGSLAGR